MTKINDYTKEGISSEIISNDSVLKEVESFDHVALGEQTESAPISKVLPNLAGYVKVYTPVFGGDGADGIIDISSGTLTIDLVSERYVVKNYKYISVTGTGQIIFSNPHANGTCVVLKVQGDVTLTSSTAPNIDASNIGATGASSSVTTGIGSTNGSDGTAASAISEWATDGGNGGAAGATPLSNTNGCVAIADGSYANLIAIVSKYPNIFVGSGGGSGGSWCNDVGGTVTSGKGGRGGGALIIECGGSWNFTTANGISVGGEDGGNGTQTGATNYVAAGGGGGGGGYCRVMYKRLIANTGTVDVSGGLGGTNSANPLAGNDAMGGSGGGGLTASSAVSNRNGGSGTDGSSLITPNTEFP